MENHDRRTFLGIASTGLAGMAGLAGCLGESGNGSENGEIALGLGVQGTVGATSGQALQSVVSDVSDDVSLTGQTTQGYPPNVFLFNDDQVDGYTAASYVHWLAQNEEGAFADRSVDELAPQGFTLGLTHMHMLAVGDSGIETYEDLPGNDVWLLPPAWGMHDLTKRLFQDIGLWSEIEGNVSPISIGDVGGAVEEGRLDAILAYGLNRNSMGGAYLDILPRADFSIVEMPDEFRQAAQERDGTSHEVLSTEALYGDTDVDFDVDEVDIYNYDVNLYFDEELPSAQIKELLEISHNNMDALRQAEPRYLDHSDIENMKTGLVADEPIHPGAAEFFRDNDAWEDDWEEA